MIKKGTYYLIAIYLIGPLSFKKPRYLGFQQLPRKLTQSGLTAQSLPMWSLHLKRLAAIRHGDNPLVIVGAIGYPTLEAIHYRWVNSNSSTAFNKAILGEFPLYTSVFFFSVMSRVFLMSIPSPSTTVDSQRSPLRSRGTEQLRMCCLQLWHHGSELALQPQVILGHESWHFGACTTGTDHNKHRKNVLKKYRKADILDVDVKKIKRLYR